MNDSCQQKTESLKQTAFRSYPPTYYNYVKKCYWKIYYMKMIFYRLNTTSKITKESKQKGRLGAASNKITGGLELLCGRLWFCFGLPHKAITNNKNQTINKKKKKKKKRAASIEGQVAPMLESNTRQIDIIDKTAMKRAEKK